MRGAQCHWGAIGRSRAVTVVCECATVPHTRRLRRPGGRRQGSLQRQVHRARCSFHLNPRSAGDWEGPGWLPLGGRITGDLKLKTLRLCEFSSEHQQCHLFSIAFFFFFFFLRKNDCRSTIVAPTAKVVGQHPVPGRSEWSLGRHPPPFSLALPVRQAGVWGDQLLL